MGFPVQIETDRLILRPYEPQDLDAHVEILGNWDVTRWLSTNIPFPYTRPDGEKFIVEAIAQFKEGSSIRYAMTDKALGRHVGGIRVFSLTPETEVGYWMHPDFWRRGLGTELLEAVISAGFSSEIITCFIAQTVSENAPSRRILEKVGFKYEGAVPEKYNRDGHCDGCTEFYRLKIEDWPPTQNRKDV